MTCNCNPFCSNSSLVLQFVLLALLIFDSLLEGKFVGEYGKHFQGDIILPAKPRVAINKTSGTFDIWPNGKVYYQFAENYNEDAKLAVTFICMEQISNHTCIEFIEEIPPDGNYIEFIQDDPDSCFADVSKIGGRQVINLPFLCLLPPGTGTHEIMHALGFVHEQSRRDRDKYIKINENNIDPDVLSEYVIFNVSDLDSFGSYYDYGSLMHYARTTFALSDANGKLLHRFEPTKLFMSPWVNASDIGQRVGPSTQDIYQIQRLYGCCSIPWNYNSSAKPIDFRKKRSVSVVSNKSRIASVKNAEKTKESQKYHAKIPLDFAISICKHQSTFVHTKNVQGRMIKSLLTKDPARIESFRNKSVIWIKCSLQNTSCRPFLFEHQVVKNKKFQSLHNDPGEFGEYFQGDLLNDPREFKRQNPSQTDVDWSWPSTQIPYRFAAHVAERDKSAILSVMADIEKRTCLKFGDPEGVDIANYVYITTNRPGCFAHFGFNRSRTVHELNLNSVGCIARIDGPGVIMHELLHIIGLPHEHTKVTRDHWITIKMDNVQRNKKYEFEPMDLGNRWTYTWPVLYDSIMMVPKDFHAKCPNLVTIEPREDIGRIVLGQRKQMTPEDIAKVVQLYRCCTKIK